MQKLCYVYNFTGSKNLNSFTKRIATLKEHPTIVGMLSDTSHGEKIKAN